MSIDERVEILKDDTLVKLKLDHYILPSILQKMFKSMKKNMVVTLTTTRVTDKLHTNFTSDFLNQYEAFKDGDTVKFTVSLFGVENTSYFYKNKATDKLEILTRLKGTAGEFFKKGNFAKAAKIYQKVNGYFNFGDVANNFSKEDEQSEEFKSAMDQLNALKLTSFTNLVVCKTKMKEFSSVIAITEQIIDMAPNHSKALFFRGRAQYMVEEFDNSIATLTKLCELSPDDAGFKQELEHAKKLHAADLKK